MTYETYKVEIDQHVAIVKFNRPDKANSMNKKAWEEMQQVFEDLDANPEVRAIVLTGEGKHFCAGIDITMLTGHLQTNEQECPGRRNEKFYYSTAKMQRNVTAIEKCRKPVIAAIHKACVGAGLDVVTTCDMRYCTEDAYFAIAEVDWALVADIGTLQRMPKIVNPGIVAELAYTGRRFEAKEAQEMGLVTRTYVDKETMLDAVLKIAQTIAEKSPLVVRGTKSMLLYTRDHSVEEALDYQVLWNAAMIFSDDLKEAAMSNMQRKKPTFQG